MLRWVLAGVGIPTISALVVFNLRRILFTGAMWIESRKPAARADEKEELPTVLVLAPSRDEQGMMPGLIQSLERLDYPDELLGVVLVDDGSVDGTAGEMSQAAGRPRWSVIRLPGLGKAGALNAALARFGFGELVCVVDADHRLAPDALRRMVAYFEDPRVAAVTGFTRVSNPLASPVAYYAALESHINQLVTMRAKDRLKLAPALLGSNCAYRRDVLSECGGFRTGSLSEDSDLTVTFHLGGYVTRFAEDAISSQQVPETVGGFLRQHVRWGRGLNDVAQTHVGHILRAPGLSVPLRLELLLFSLGYLDRLAVMGTGALIAIALLGGQETRVFSSALLIALAVPLVQILALFLKERVSWALWLRLPLVPLFFALDVLAAARAALDTARRTPRRWARTERPGESTP